jgi:ribosomal-protein-serine acetyltransferase
MNKKLTRQNEALIVRPLKLGDANNFLKTVLSSIETLSKKFGWAKYNYAKADAVAYIEYGIEAAKGGTAVPLGIFSIETGEVLGSTGIHGINQIHRFGSIGYWIGNEFQRQGIARAAARMVADIGFVDLGLTRLEIVARHDNEASQKVAIAIGAKLECIARNRLNENGLPVNAKVFSIIPQDLGY